jgi:hypothetical protein
MLALGAQNLTLGARNVIWIFLFHFSFVSSASWLILEGVMSTTHQAVITLSRIVFSCDGWLRRAVLISRIRIIHLHEFFFISWAGSHAKDDCYMGRTHRSLQDKLKSIVCSMFTVGALLNLYHHHPRVFPRSSGRGKDALCNAQGDSALLPLQPLSYSRQPSSPLFLLYNSATPPTPIQHVAHTCNVYPMSRQY